MHLVRAILTVVVAATIGSTQPLASTVGPVDETGTAASLRTGPDRTLDVRGGVAARAYVVDGDPVRVPGDVFVLLGSPDSPRTVRIFDEHPHIARSAPRPEVDRANGTAAWTVERILGHEIDRRTLTYSDGGGDSGGLAYTISYLDLELDGGFTGGLRVAATGRVLDGERVMEVLAIDEKTVAAAGADVDVVFVPARPSETIVTAIGGRALEVPVRSSGAPTLADQRGWDRYGTWGATRSPAHIDVITVHHLGDVAAYLCGAGTASACDVLDLMTDVFDPSRVDDGY